MTITESRSPATPAQLAWLDRQLPAWQEAGLLDASTALAIRGRYTAERSLSIGRLMLALGGLFVGVGLIWLVAANLDQFAPTTRWLVVTVLWVAAVSAAELLDRRVPDAVTWMLRLVGALGAGAVVFQAAQSLQVPAYEPRLVGCWAAIALVHAYAVRSVAPLLVGVPAGVVWFVWQLMWAEPSSGALVWAFAAASVLMVAVAAWPGQRPDFAVVWRETGAVLGLVTLFAAALPFVGGDDFVIGPWLVGGALVALLAAGVALVRADRTARIEVVSVLALAALAGVLVLWEAGDDITAVGVEDWLHALVSVGAYLLVAFGVVAVGTMRDSWRLTAAATIALVVFTTFQSFAVFAAIIQGAWLFLVLGLVFIGTGWVFNRARQELAAVLEGDER